MSDQQTESDSIIRFATERAKPDLFTIERGDASRAQVVALQRGQELHGIKKLLDAYLPRPERRTGTTCLHDPDSFVAFVQRSKCADSVIYLDAPTTTFTAVFDHDAAGPDGAETARWGQHRATWAAKLSDEWVAWTKPDNAALSQADFAAFIEERALDLLDPAEAEGHPVVALAARLGLKLSSPAEVIAASRGLRLRAEVNVGEAVVLDSGETELHFAERHTGADGSALVVPTAFLVGIPVLEGAPRDVLLARLRYRRVQGQPRVVWAVSLHRPDEVKRAALDEVAGDIRTRTELPVLRGTAPAPR